MNIEHTARNMQRDWKKKFDKVHSTTKWGWSKYGKQQVRPLKESKH